MKKLLFICIFLSGLLFYSCSSPSTPSTNSNTQFEITLNASPAESGSVSPSSGQYEEGSTVDISATPNEDWRFDHWEGDFNGSSSTAEITANSDKDITAIFEKKSYELTITTDGSGTVDENVVTSKAESYEAGTVVELTANAAEEWVFVEWKGDVAGTQNPQQITVDNPKEVTAVFEKKTYPLTVNTQGEGTVDQQTVQNKVTDYESGTVVELTANAALGWTFSEWSGALNGTENPKQITVDNAKEVTAIFVQSGNFYLDENGITVKCPDANVGDTGIVNGTVYTKRSADQITPGNAETTCTSGITEMDFLFNGASSFNGDINSWDVSSVTDMSYMFSSAYDFNTDISSWDVSSVENMKGMFEGAESFNQSLNSWDVSSVTNMELMFLEAEVFNQSLDSWDVSSVTSMTDMFYYAIAFNGTIGSWDVSSVTNMENMFADAESFNQDLNNWIVTSVTTMADMFYHAASFNGNISNWDVSNMEDMEGMFLGATSFNQDLSNWDVAEVYSMDYMFKNATSFDQDISGWCVIQINSQPYNFSTGSPLTLSQKPSWGLCP